MQPTTQYSKIFLGIDLTVEHYLTEIVLAESAHCDPGELASIACTIFGQGMIADPTAVQRLIAFISQRFAPADWGYVEKAILPFAQHVYTEFYHLRRYAPWVWQHGVFTYRFERMTEAKIVMVHAGKPLI